jgi:hypothetical protein
VLAPFGGKVAGELQHGGLGCVVRPASRQPQWPWKEKAILGAKLTGRSTPCWPPSRSYCQ